MYHGPAVFAGLCAKGYRGQHHWQRVMPDPTGGNHPGVIRNITDGSRGARRHPDGPWSATLILACWIRWRTFSSTLSVRSRRLSAISGVRSRGKTSLPSALSRGETKNLSPNEKHPAEDAPETEKRKNNQQTSARCGKHSSA